MDTIQVAYREFVAEAYSADRPLPIKIQDVKYPERVIRFRASDDTLDRYGEVILAEGWDFSDYVKNPVVMQMHDYQQWPIGHAVAVGVVGNALYIDAEIDPPEVDDVADLIFRKIKHGTVKAGSVGFMPVASIDVYQNPNNDLFKKYPGAKRIYTKSALLEWTICPIGANPNALVAQMKRVYARLFGSDPAGADKGEDAAAKSAIMQALEKFTKRLEK